MGADGKKPIGKSLSVANLTSEDFLSIRFSGSAAN